MRKTKIIATLGPSCSDYDTLYEMIKAGVNVVRINMAHGDYEPSKKLINIVKKVREDLGVPVGIMVDIKGPEVRTGEVNGKIEVKKGQELILTGEKIVAHDNIFSCNYPKIAKDVKVGGKILLSDGTFVLQIIDIKDGLIYTKALNDGLLGSHKNMHFPGVSLKIPYIRQKDKKDMLFAIENDVDFIAFSFVSKASEMRECKEFLNEHGANNISLISKIENAEGINNLDEIMKEVDGIMVARGDLGVELPIEDIPNIQKQMIRRVHLAGKRVITATEMLETMTHNNRPTRAEVSDVANAVYDGTSCVMLSGETAVGDYPVEVVKTMSNICIAAENSINYSKNFKKIDFNIVDVSDALSHSSVNAAIDLNAKAIVVCTKSGQTAMLVSRFRPVTPIIAYVTEFKAYQQLSMSWGVEAYRHDEYNSTEELVIRAIDKAKTLPFIKKEDTIILLAGIAKQVHGSNIMRIEKI